MVLRPEEEARGGEVGRLRGCWWGRDRLWWRLVVKACGDGWEEMWAESGSGFGGWCRTLGWLLVLAGFGLWLARVRRRWLEFMVMRRCSGGKTREARGRERAEL